MTSIQDTVAASLPLHGVTGLAQGRLHPVQRGFTLIEMMIAVAVVAILAALAAPNMSQFLSARRVEDVARRLGDDLAFARNEAVKRNAPVLMCTGPTGTACDAAPATAAWATGWRVCFDTNPTNGTCDNGSATDKNPMRVQDAPTNVTVVGPTSSLSFNPNGSLSATDLTAYKVKSSRADLTVEWTVSIAASGAVTVRKVNS